MSVSTREDAAPDQRPAPERRYRLGFPPAASLPSWVLGVLGALVMIALWQAAHSLEWMSPRLLPAPGTVAVTLVDLFGEGYGEDVAISVWRIVLSFAIACAVAIPLGLVIGASQVASAWMSPTISAFRYLPAPAFTPLLLMWLGPGDEQKIALLILGVIWFLITLIADHVRAVRKELIETALTLGASTRQLYLTVILPAAAPRIWDALRQMLAVSWTYLVIAEIVAATNGIGAMMMRAQRFVRVDEVMAGIVTIGLLGILFDLAFRAAGAKLFHYERHERLQS